MRLPWQRSDHDRDELDCHEVARVIQHHLDGELDPAAARQVAAHLDDCRRCGLEAATYRELKHHLAGVAPRVEPEAVDRLRAFVDTLTEHADT